MKSPKILAFAGSTRSGSFNKKLVALAAAGARDAGAEVTVIDLRDFPLPLFDEDLESEHGLPENAKKLKALLLAHDGLLIASPEYNSSITGVLKNSIDWASRTATDEEPALAGFRGKIAAICSASPGGLGGLRGLVTLRSILGNIGVLVLPDQIAISSAGSAFDADGQLKDALKQSHVKALGKSLSDLIARTVSA